MSEVERILEDVCRSGYKQLRGKVSRLAWQLLEQDERAGKFVESFSPYMKEAWRLVKERRSRCKI